MPLTPGTRIGPYEITAAIGAGGMGEVYRANDTTLDRDVAIKVLPENFAADRERATRFTREAKTLASLNHQNIAHVHGVVELPAEAGSHSSQQAPAIALVMEFVDGEDLAQRFRQGPIPLDDAIPIAKQIADALECAHEQGIVHRDLKPANVKVRPDGVVKVLDFGLAKALSAPNESSSGISSSMMLSPTFTSPAMTQMGIILGTAAYMAPEQARGKAVDKRADIWAFGVVLFEMLSGVRAFEGSEVSDTLAFVLTREPEWDALPKDTPSPIRRLLARCLHKDRKQRLADISDARLELEEALRPQPPSQPAMVVAPKKRWLTPAVAAASLAAGVLIGVPATLKWIAPAPPPPPVVRFSVTLPEGVTFSNTGRHYVNISRDGSKIVYTAASQIYVRPIDGLAAAPIPGSAGAVINPVFSPDGESVAFYTENTLKRMPVAGGTPFTLTTGFSNPYGMHWTAQGIFAGQQKVGIVRVPEAGGKPDVVATVGADETAHGPQLLDDGETIVFTVYAATGVTRYDNAKIVAHSLRTGERKVLYEGGADGQVVPTGHLLFGNGGVVYALKFDPKTLGVSGTPTPLLQGVRQSVPTGAVQARVAANGTLIYVPGPSLATGAPRSLGLMDRSGKATVLPVTANMFEAPRLSPDGARIAVTVAAEQETDIYVQDLPVKSVIRRLTFGGRSRYPVWSPDSKQFAFRLVRDGTEGVYVQDADISGGEARLLLKAPTGSTVVPTGWSVDGALAVTVVKDRDAAVHLFSQKDGKLTRLAVHGDGIHIRSAAFSPDGKWIAYQAGPDGAPPSTFLEPFPQTGARYQIGPGSGPAFSATWGPRGGELFVTPATQHLLVYPIATAPRFAVGEPQQVSRAVMAPGTPTSGRMWDVTRDGKQFVIITPTTGADAIGTQQINVVVNWFSELTQRR